MNKWKEIWNNRGILDRKELDKNEFDLFCELKKLNGFDISVSEPKAAYRSFYNEMLQMFNKVEGYIGEYNSLLIFPVVEIIRSFPETLTICSIISSRFKT